MITRLLSYFYNSVFGSQPTNEQEPLTEQANVKQANVIDNFVKEHYRPMVSNTDLKNAQVILLGECHYNEQNRKVNGQLIDLLSSDKDLLLTEYDDDYYQQQQKKFGEPPKELPLPPKPGEPGYDPELIIQYSENVLKEVGRELVGGVDCVDAAPRQAKYVIHSLKKKGWDFNSDKKLDYWLRALRKADLLSRVSQELPQRNRHLCKTIEENIEPGKKIFVIAGAAHLQPSSENPGPGILGQDEVYKETLDYLKTKKFAILIPKDLKSKS